MTRVLIIISLYLVSFASCKNDNSKVEELEKKLEQQSTEMQNMKEDMLEKELEQKQIENAHNEREVLTNGTSVYHGAWFDIKYPSEFIAKGSIPSISSDGFDSATFTSPDNSVEFYVFSPQWNGEAHDIAVREHETRFNSKTDDSNSRIVEWWTIEAKDKSYTRSYQKTIDKQSNTVTIIGLKYKNQESYNKHKKQYLDFKASLKQYAD